MKGTRVIDTCWRAEFLMKYSVRRSMRHVSRVILHRRGASDVDWHCEGMRAANCLRPLATLAIFPSRAAGTAISLVWVAHRGCYVNPAPGDDVKSRALARAVLAALPARSFVPPTDVDETSSAADGDVAGPEWMEVATVARALPNGPALTLQHHHRGALVSFLRHRRAEFEVREAGGTAFVRRRQRWDPSLSAHSSPRAHFEAPRMDAAQLSMTQRRRMRRKYAHQRQLQSYTKNTKPR